MAQSPALEQKQMTAPSTANISLPKRIRWNIADTIVITQRNLVYYIRQPELLVFSTIQPVMFVLLFAYVFGGAIQTGSGDYINYLLPGIITQTVIFGATSSTVGLAVDLSKGMIDRFRSLPMSRGSVLAGRTLADTGRNIFVVILMVLVGTLIGFRAQGGFLALLGGMGIAVAFGYSFTWISALIGLTVKNVEAAQVAGFIWVFPLVFASSIFVPPETMPEWLQVFAENQPITAVANAVRGLFLGTADAGIVLTAIGWIALIFAIFAPLAVRQYRLSVN